MVVGEGGVNREGSFVGSYWDCVVFCTYLELSTVNKALEVLLLKMAGQNECVVLLMSGVHFHYCVVTILKSC